MIPKCDCVCRLCGEISQETTVFEIISLERGEISFFQYFVPLVLVEQAMVLYSRNMRNASLMIFPNIQLVILWNIYLLGLSWKNHHLVNTENSGTPIDIKYSILKFYLVDDDFQFTTFPCSVFLLAECSTIMNMWQTTNQFQMVNYSIKIIRVFENKNLLPPKYIAALKICLHRNTWYFKVWSYQIVQCNI